MNIESTMLIEMSSRMMSIAYRMLGSIAEAEDVVQDAFLRFQLADDVKSPEGFLVRVTTRLCIDRLRSIRRQEYVGPWLPEPVETKRMTMDSMLAESLTQAFLLLLERLSPYERAAFLLRAVFDYEYAEIAAVIDKSEEHVRQIVSRARQRLGRDEARFQSSPEKALELAERFVAACRSGDVKQIEAMFDEGISVHSDGGGKISASRVVIRGQGRAARFLAGVFHKKRRNCDMAWTTVNGEPGVVFRSDGIVIQVVSFRIEHRILAVYMTLNPDKLARWSAAEIT